MKKVLAKLKLFFLMFFILLGCSKNKIPRDQSLIVAIPNAPILLDPRLAVDAEGQKIAALLYDGLVTLNEKQEVIPLLARRWEKVEPLAYRFYLREDVRFSNGKRLEAKDVLCTYRFIQAPKNASPLRAEFEKIAEVLAIDPQTVFIRLKEAYAPFFLLLKKGIVACDGTSGSGPYTLLQHQPGRKIVLKANPSYFSGPPQIPHLIFEVVKEDTTRVLKLLSQEVDLIQNAVPPVLIEKVLKKKTLKMQRRPGTTFSYLGINLKDPVLKNKKVRQAIAYAIDRDQVIQHLWKGFARKADTLLAPGHWAFDPNVEKYPYDLARAQRLLKEAGLSNVVLTLKTSTLKERIEIARMIAHQLGKAGIVVSVHPFEWGTFFHDIQSGNFQLYTLSWVGVVEPDLYYNILHTSQFPPVGANRGFFQDKRVDPLVEQGRQLMEREGRVPLYHAVQNIVAEELPFIPLWYEENVVIYDEDLQGVRLSPNPDYRDLVKVHR